jgi:hypothetical protein
MKTSYALKEKERKSKLEARNKKRSNKKVEQRTKRRKEEEYKTEMSRL